MNYTIAICICTYRRAHVADTIRSLKLLALKPEWTLHLIVADNDDEPSARPTVEAAAHEAGLPLTYLHAPARNISIARNACLKEAQSDLLAFIDDDELVTRDWLAAMIQTLEATYADAVLGPVNAIYDANAPQWLRNGDFHSTRPVINDGFIATGYAGNVLIRGQSAALKGLCFREELGQSGGEDTAFFSAMVKAGGTIAYASNAVATEIVPADKATLRWLLKRRFRSGQTHGTLLMEQGQGTASHLVKAYLKAVFCACIALLCIIDSTRFRFWVLRGAMHAGVMSRLLGKRELQLYG